MASDDLPLDPPFDAGPPSGAVDAPLPFRQIVARGFAATNRTLLAPLLVFLILGPQQTGGALAILFAKRGNFQPVPGTPPSWELFALAFIGLGTCAWLPVILFGLPWVSGGAIGQLTDRIARPGRRPRPYVDYANRYYGRILVLMVFFGLAITAIHMPNVLISGMVAEREGVDAMQADMEAIGRMSRHPINIATTALVGLVAAGVAVVWSLSDAAVAVEDQGVVGAIRRGVTFVRDQPADTFRMYLVVVAINAPIAVVQQSLLVMDLDDALFIAVTVASIVASSYAIVLYLALAVSLYVERRAPTVVV